MPGFFYFHAGLKLRDMQQSINPFNQQLLAEFPVLSKSEISRKLEKSAQRYTEWRRTPFSHRAEILNKVAELLLKDCEKFARIISLEMGKVLSESRAEVKKCADGCRYYATNAGLFLQDQAVQTDALKSYVAYQPIGAVLAVMPWNFPFWQVIRFAAPALMAGNTALLKHSSNVPQCSLAIEKLFLEGGLPEGVFQSLLISNESVEEILSSDIVQGLALTGSEKAGSTVGSIAAKHIKKSVLELGGSDPFIVLPGANIEKSARIALQSRMQNAGQSCIAAKRFIVLKEVKDEFVKQLRSMIEDLKQGDPLDEATTTGPLARVDLAEELEHQLKRAIQQGGQLLTGGEREGANFSPALLDGVTTVSPAFVEETFGPLAAVTEASSVEDAVRLANQSRFGLGASVWTGDLELAERVARQIESGTVYVNSLMRSDARLPFGGVKKSGYGRELAREGILEFVNTKSIAVFD